MLHTQAGSLAARAHSSAIASAHSSRVAAAPAATVPQRACGGTRVCAAAQAAAQASPAGADHPAARLVAALASSLILIQAGGSGPAYAAAGPVNGAPAVEAAAAAAAASAAPAAVCPVGDVAGLFGGSDDEGPEPFTLYGSNYKMFSIEELDGNKVLSRSRGFTVDTCVSAVDEDMESPEFQGLSPGDKLRSGSNLLCKRATGPELKPACATSCKEACTAALDAEVAKQRANTGLQLSDADRKRVLRNCTRQCNYGCVGSGKSHDFVAPSRR